jgi:hypothetical protein
MPPIPERPSKEVALAALELLKELLALDLAGRPEIRECTRQFEVGESRL